MIGRGEDKMEIKKILREAYLEYGDTVFLNNQRLISCMKDLLSAYPSDFKKLSLLANESIAYKIINEISECNLERCAIFISDIVENYSMDIKVATKYVNYFVYATKGKEYQQDDKNELSSKNDTTVKTTSITEENTVWKGFEKEKDINKDFESTELVIEDIFAIAGRGVVLVGEISKGEIFVGDDLYIENNKCIVTAIEKFRKLIDHATHEDGKIGLLVKNIKKDDVKVGMVVKKNQSVDIPTQTVVQTIPQNVNTYRINNKQIDVELAKIEKNGYSIYSENSVRKINHSMLNCVVYYTIDYGITSIEIDGTELSRKEMLKLKLNRKIEFDVLKIMAQDIFSLGKIEGITFVCTNGYWEVKYICCEGDVQEFNVADDLNLIQNVMKKNPYDTLDYDSKVRIEKVFILCEPSCNKQIMVGDWTTEYKSLLAIDLFLQKFDEQIGRRKRSDLLRFDISIVTHDQEFIRLYFTMLRLLHRIAKRLEVRNVKELLDCVKMMNTLMDSVFGYRK